MKLSWPLMVRRVQGHSMVPVLPPGTVVFGWKWFVHLQPDKVVIFTRDHRETVKRIEHIEPEGLFVIGDHPETSTDSRHYGVIPQRWVKATVIWPLTAKVFADETSTLPTVNRLKDS